MHDATSPEPELPPVGPTDNSTDSKNNNKNLADIDWIELFVAKMPIVPRIAVGIFLALLGMMLCLFGGQFMKVIFGLISMMCISFLVLAIML